MTHGAVAVRHLGADFVNSITSPSWREADIPPAMKATLVFLEKLTLRPEEVTPLDAKAALDVGVEPIDLEHAVIVLTAFSVINRMVDAFGADVSDELALQAGKVLDRAGGLIGKKAKEGVKDPPFAGRIPDYIDAYLTPIREGEGDAPQDIRVAIEARVAASAGTERPTLELDPVIADFVDKVGGDVFSLQDEDFANLQAIGWSEEAIYEFVFVASVGSAMGRFECAWNVINEAST